MLKALAINASIIFLDDCGPVTQPAAAYLEVHCHIPDALGAQRAGVVVPDVRREAARVHEVSARELLDRLEAVKETLGAHCNGVCVCVCVHTATACVGVHGGREGGGPNRIRAVLIPNKGG